jgi:hypothetical protein
LFLLADNARDDEECLEFFVFNFLPLLPMFVDDFNGINLLKKHDASSLLLRTLNVMMMMMMMIIMMIRRFL